MITIMVESWINYNSRRIFVYIRWNSITIKCLFNRLKQLDLYMLECSVPADPHWTCLLLRDEL